MNQGTQKNPEAAGVSSEDKRNKTENKTSRVSAEAGPADTAKLNPSAT
jgi:hypothetical protein